MKNNYFPFHTKKIRKCHCFLSFVNLFNVWLNKRQLDFSYLLLCSSGMTSYVRKPLGNARECEKMRVKKGLRDFLKSFGGFSDVPRLHSVKWCCSYCSE